ncbi:MAG: alpha/beta hydrolase [Oligoflexia bacterium]|nr:alpha/beta hydrolase [Oligoflexia bacterium]
MKSWSLDSPSIFSNKQQTASYRKIGSGKRKLLFFHGFPGSSAQISAFYPVVEKLNLEVLCIDRPGYGKSTATMRDNQFSLYEKSCEHLLKKFGWEKYELLSVSGGTPFAFYHLNKNVAKIEKFSVVSGLGPVQQKQFRKTFSSLSYLGFLLLPQVPQVILLKGSDLILKAGQRKRRSSIMELFFPISEKDKECMQKVEVNKVLNSAIQEAFEQRGLGPQLDAMFYTKNWWVNQYTDLGSKIHFWHGSDDRILYPSMAKALHQRCKKSKLTMVDHEGHYSLIINRIEEILK